MRNTTRWGKKKHRRRKIITFDIETATNRIYNLFNQYGKCNVQLMGKQSWQYQNQWWKCDPNLLVQGHILKILSASQLWVGNMKHMLEHGDVTRSQAYVTPHNDPTKWRVILQWIWIVQHPQIGAIDKGNIIWNTETCFFLLKTQLITWLLMIHHPFTQI